MSKSPAKLPVDERGYETLLGYLRAHPLDLPAAKSDPANVPPVASAVDPAAIEQELLALPADQVVYAYREFKVYVGQPAQIPETLREITRQRERTFRALQEGSGEAEDTDEFDSSYLHLLAWDWDNHAMVGGYRLGRTDELLAASGTAGIYLSAMFEFREDFFAGSPMLEIGRSFVVPEYQRNHSSLYLLWSGISRYLIQHPQYRRLYGVVSISRLYKPCTMAVIRDAILEPNSDVVSQFPFDQDLGQLWDDYLAANGPLPLRELSRLVKALEGDERDVPVLIRHYQKLGSRFVSAAVDEKFNNTPGLLLQLDVTGIPSKYMKLYFGEGASSYLAYQPSSA